VQRGREFAFPDAAHIGAVFEKGGGHCSWFIDVEIDANTEFPGTLDQGAEIGQTLLVAGPRIRGTSCRPAQVSQKALQPYAIDPYGREPFSNPSG